MPKVHAGATDGGGVRTRRGGARLSSTLSEINVIPLVDVMLVLLVIFMVTAPMMQRGIDVALPEARRAQSIASERVFITVPLAFRTTQVVQIGDESVRVEILDERVRQELADQPDKEVFLRGDGGVTLQELMTVMDKLKDGGVEKVGIVARLPGER